LGEQSLHVDFGKIFKPITEQQQKSSEEIVSKFAPLQEAIENMPARQALPWEPEPRGGHKWEIFVRPIWEKYVKAPKHKAKHQQRKSKVKAFFQAIQIPCVNVWNC